MRISSWFNKGRSSTLQYLSLTSFSIQYRSLKTPILSLEPTKWVNLFALAILRKKNKLKGRLRRKEINKDMNTWEKQIGVGHELCDGGIGVRGDRWDGGWRGGSVWLGLAGHELGERESE